MTVNRLFGKSTCSLFTGFIADLVCWIDRVLLVDGAVLEGLSVQLESLEVLVGLVLLIAPGLQIERAKNLKLKSLNLSICKYLITYTFQSWALVHFQTLQNLNFWALK